MEGLTCDCVRGINDQKKINQHHQDDFEEALHCCNLLIYVDFFDSYVRIFSSYRAEKFTFSLMLWRFVI